ncbi:Eukaryotic aspartyl protease [Phytophthora infestans]|uniref:Eukaryotic aspartyl protease n=1 Tax=Phytophthora infestans TaxID=4787 RepID=A0A833WMV0_PHYIN|nr:Eukaryotic aspartyl protease [Phytophthora infestans]KAF4032315.1 Eukaryotic aspartyl protease [Phytophthora infestans]KAF4140487.1 Eukaryotic aspartyl protease [Phytophthora infestans]
MGPRRVRLAAMALSLFCPCANSTTELIRIPLENYDQMQFFGSIGVGSPPQRFQVIFDTGSSDIWLPESSCADCAGSRRYHAAVSRSHEPLNEPFRLEYGSGNASGRVMREQVSLFGGDEQSLTLSRVHMGSTTKTTKSLQRFQADGIVGLGLEALAVITKPSLLKSDPRLGLFSIYINPLPGALPPAQLIFGGVDDSLPIAHIPHANEAQVSWHHFPLVRYPSSRRAHGFWAIRLHRLTVGNFDSRSKSSPKKLAGSGDGIVAVSAAVAIVDSGTSLLLLPRRAFDTTITEIQQHLRVQHSKELRVNPHAVSGYACVDCTAEMFPALRFSFVIEETPAGSQSKTQTLVLKGTDYARCDDLMCAPQLDVHALFTSKSKSKVPTPAASAMTTNIPQGTEHEDVVVLGVTFMRAYYVQFDSQRKTVGFACVDSATSSAVCSGGWAPKLQFHSAHFLDAEASAWRAGWVFWSRVYLGIGVLLLLVAFALLWLILVVPSSEVKKVFNWFYGPSDKSRRRQQQTECKLLPTRRSSYQGQSSDSNRDDETAEPDSEPESPPAPSRRKSVSFDV